MSFCIFPGATTSASPNPMLNQPSPFARRAASPSRASRCVTIRHLPERTISYARETRGRAERDADFDNELRFPERCGRRAVRHGPGGEPIRLVAGARDIGALDLGDF